MSTPAHPGSAPAAPLRSRLPHSSHDELSLAQRRTIVAAIAALHLVGAWAVLQLPAVHEAAVQVAPLFVDLIAPQRPAAPPAPPAPPVPPSPVPTPRPGVVSKKPPPLPQVIATASPAPAAVAVAPPPEAPPAEAPVAAAPPASPVAAVPAPPPPPPKTLPASAVQYLEAPVLEYPRASRRAAESGRVLVRVFIDEAGLPRTVTLSQSSGHARLDEAALAAVRGARFKPYTENGQPMAGWAFIPLIFDLEQ